MFVTAFRSLKHRLHVCRLSNTHTRAEHDEEEAGGDRDLGEVSQDGRLLQPDEGGEGLLQEVNLANQDVGGLRTLRYLLHEVAINLQINI